MNRPNTTYLTIHGISGELMTGTYSNSGRARQRWESEGRPYPEYGRKSARIHMCIQFDNEHGNTRPLFSVTAFLSGVREEDMGSIGAAHDDLAKAFPELAHLNRWHMANTEGPWGYEANAVYLAGDRDSRGKRAGEPWAWHDAVRFGSLPMLYRIKEPMRAFLEEVMTYDPEGIEAALAPIAVAYQPSGERDHKLSPKYQFAGEPVRKWHDCAFDTEQEAEAFGASVLAHGITLERIPYLFSDGKARDLDGARSAAIWPDATDAELMAEPEVLREALRARLPGLMDQFRADVAAAGLAWPEA